MIITGTTKLSDSVLGYLAARPDTLFEASWHGENAATIVLGDPAFRASYIIVKRDALAGLKAIASRIDNPAFNRGIERLCK